VAEQVAAIMNVLIEFIFPRRLHRLGYFIRLLLSNVVTYFLYSCSTTMSPQLFLISVGALLVYVFLFIGLPRIRDLGMSGWWLLVFFVPVVNIWLGLILLFRAPSYGSRVAVSGTAE
jgi:uncharacterized membrane protein YhaH (DUF805 family)